MTVYVSTTRSKDARAIDPGDCGTWLGDWISSDPEAKVLLDDTDEEEAYIPPVVLNKKKAATSSKKGKSDFETDEDPSFFSDDLESHQFM